MFRRRLLPLAAVASLLLFGVVAAMTVRGFFVQDEWRWISRTVERDVPEPGNLWVGQTSWFLTAGRGGFAAGRGTNHFSAYDPAVFTTTFTHSTYAAVYPAAPADTVVDDGTLFTFLGLQYLTERYPTAYSVQGDDGTVRMSPVIPPDIDRHAHLTLPAHLLLPLLGVLPITWLLTTRRRRRQLARTAAGHCLACGYDLRSGGQTVCPECGRVGGG